MSRILINEESWFSSPAEKRQYLRDGVGGVSITAEFDRVPCVGEILKVKGIAHYMQVVEVILFSLDMSNYEAAIIVKFLEEEEEIA